MKKFFISVFAAVVCAISFDSRAQIAVGPKAGINFNSFRNSATYKNHFDVVPGFNVGGFAKYPVLDFLSARAEILYFQQGANIYDYAVVNELYRKDARVRFHNVAIPVLAEFGIPSLKEDAIQPKLLLGGFYSYTFYTRESYTNVAKIAGRPSVEYDGYSETQNQYKRSQFGLIGAIAADLKMFGKPVSLEFRYQYNIPRLNNAGTQNDINLKPTTSKWGNDLHIHTLSINVGVTLANF
jgi:hypothetical protein